MTQVQYGSRVSMCDSLTAAAYDDLTLLRAVADMGSKSGVAYADYDAGFQKRNNLHD